MNGFVLKVTWTVGGEAVAQAFFNPNAEESEIVLDGSWNAVFGSDAKGISGPQKLAGKGVILLEKAN